MRVIVGQIPIGAPLPDIACHIIKAVAVWRERGHWRGPSEAVFQGVLCREAALPGVGFPFAAGLLFLAPNVGLSLQAAARGEFPFRFGWQPLVCPAAISYSIVPGHVDDRMLLATLEVTGGPFRMAPIGARHVAPPEKVIIERDIAERLQPFLRPIPVH